MLMSPDEIVTQFQQIVETLRRVVEASADVADRVEVLEHDNGEKIGLLTGLQGNLKLLLETYQAHIEAQNATNANVGQAIAGLEARVAALETGR